MTKKVIPSMKKIIRAGKKDFGGSFNDYQISFSDITIVYSHFDYECLRKSKDFERAIELKKIYDSKKS